MVLSSADIFSKSVSLFFVLFFSKKSFENNISSLESSRLDPDHAQVLSGLIRVQIVCKGYQQTTLVSKEFVMTIQAN